MSSPGSWIPLSLSSENTVDPIEPNGTNPKSTVISPLASSAASFAPFFPGSPTGSAPATSEITGEVIMPSVRPSPFVSACIPLSSPSTWSSAVLVGVEDTGSEVGGKNSMK